MFRVTKTVEIHAAHRLRGDIESEQCKGMHGHTYQIEVEVEAQSLNRDGMVVDFGVISRVLKTVYDHQLLDFHGPNPTTEVFAADVEGRIRAELFRLQTTENRPRVSRVSIKESPSSRVDYYPAPV